MLHVFNMWLTDFKRVLVFILQSVLLIGIRTHSLAAI